MIDALEQVGEVVGVEVEHEHAAARVGGDAVRLAQVARFGAQRLGHGCSERLPLEDRDALRHAVLENLEFVLRQIGNRHAAGGRIRVDHDEVDGPAEDRRLRRVLRLRRLRAGGQIQDRERGERREGHESAGIGTRHAQAVNLA